MIKKLAVWTFVLVVLIGGGVSAAELWQGPGKPEPIRRAALQSPQKASAVSNGVELKVTSASFSGTETLLQMQAGAVDAAQIQQLVGQAKIDRIIPARDGFSGPFGGTTLFAGPDQDGSFLVHLPPLTPPPGYDGTVGFAVRAVNVRTDKGDTRLEGTWDLNLNGPVPGSVARALQVEELQQTTLVARGQTLVVSGRRSTSETQIELNVPPLVTVLTQPYLLVEGKRIPQLAIPGIGGNTNGIVRLSFPPSAFGTPLTVDLGPLAVADSPNSGATITMVTIP